MKMTNDANDDKALETLFESARNDAPDLAPDFLARLVTDADQAIDVQTENVAPSPAPISLWARISATLVPVSGLAAATLAGVWIGFQVPSTDFTDGLSFTDSSDFDVSVFLPAVGLSGFSDLEVDG